MKSDLVLRCGERVRKWQHVVAAVSGERWRQCRPQCDSSIWGKADCAAETFQGNGTFTGGNMLSHLQLGYIAVRVLFQLVMILEQEEMT